LSEKPVQIEDVAPIILCLMEVLPNVIQLEITPAAQNGVFVVQTQSIVNVKNVWTTQKAI
jgi:hypothetical protein